MGQSTADVRRDIELTRDRMSDTIAQIEHKLNVGEMVRDNPLPALAIAVGAGFLLSRASRNSTTAKVGKEVASGAASAAMGGMLSGVAERFFGGVSDVLGARVDGWVDDLRQVVVPEKNAAGADARRVEQIADSRDHAHRG